MIFITIYIAREPRPWALIYLWTFVAPKGEGKLVVFSRGLDKKVRHDLRSHFWHQNLPFKSRWIVIDSTSSYSPIHYPHNPITWWMNIFRLTKKMNIFVAYCASATKFEENGGFVTSDRQWLNTETAKFWRCSNFALRDYQLEILFILPYDTVHVRLVSIITRIMSKKDIIL